MLASIVVVRQLLDQKSVSKVNGAVKVLKQFNKLLAYLILLAAAIPAPATPTFSPATPFLPPTAPIVSSAAPFTPPTAPIVSPATPFVPLAMPPAPPATPFVALATPFFSPATPISRLTAAKMPRKVPKMWKNPRRPPGMGKRRQLAAGKFNANVPSRKVEPAAGCYTNFFAICSSRISCTVRATMTLWLRLKNDSISCKASDE